MQHLTIALAGTDTKELFTLLVTFFGKGTDIDPFSFIDAAPVIKRPLDLTDTESEEEDAASTSTQATGEPSTSTADPPVKKPIKLRQKASYQDMCTDIQEAIGFLPESAGSLHNTGIPDLFAVRRAGKNEHGTSIYSCPHPQCSDPPYTGDISGCGSHVRRVHLGHCVSCPYCPDKKYYNADGWRRHMREKHNKAPWYSGDVRAPTASSTEAAPSTTTDPALPAVSVSAWEDTEPPADTLPLVDTADDSEDTPPEPESTDTAIARPPTPSTETIEQQLEKLPSDTREYDYAVHSTGHPAAPVIVSRWRRFDVPDDASKVAQEMMSPSVPDRPDPETESAADPPRRKRRKEELCVQLEPTRSLTWKPRREDDPDVPPSMV